MPLVINNLEGGYTHKQTHTHAHTRTHIHIHTHSHTYTSIHANLCTETIFINQAHTDHRPAWSGLEIIIIMFFALKV